MRFISEKKSPPPGRALLQFDSGLGSRAFFRKRGKRLDGVVYPLFPKENNAEQDTHDLIQRDGPPQSDDIPVEYPAGQAAQHHPNQPDAGKRNDHRGVFMTCRTDGTVKNLRQVLRDLGKSHDENIFHADFDQFLFIGQKAHEQAGAEKQYRAGKDADGHGDAAQPLKLHFVKRTVTLADGAGREGR